MNKSRFNFISIILIFFAAACGMFIPGFFLKQSSESLSGQIQKAPATIKKGYGNTSIQLASSQLTEYEKIKIIVNPDNPGSPVYKSNTHIKSNYTMVELAKDRLEKLYLSKLYPSSFKDKTGNWYSYDVTCFEATDSTFQIFSSYYWLITLTKYDKSENHTVLITENGTILYAQAVISGTVDKPSSIEDRYSYLYFLNGKASSYAPVTDSNAVTLPSYSNINFVPENPEIGILTIGCPWMTTEKTVKDNYELHPEYEYYYALSDCKTNKSLMQYTIEILPYQ